MKYAWKLYFLLIIVLVLYGCQDKQYEPLDQNESFVATLNIRNQSIDFFDKNGKQLSEWKFDKLYTGGALLQDGDTLVLYNPQLETVDVYSLKAGQLTNHIKTGKGISNMAEITSQSLLAFANKEKNEVHFYDHAGNKVKSVETGDYPMAMKTDEDFLYVAAFQGKTLSIINLENYQVEKEIAIPSSSAGMLIRGRDAELWLGGHGEGSKPQSAINIYSLDSNRFKQELPAPLMPVDFYENHQGIYVISHGTNMLYHFDADKNLLHKVEVGANPFALDYFAGYIVVTGFDSEELYWIHPDTLKIERQMKVGEGPFVIFTREKVKQ